MLKIVSGQKKILSMHAAPAEVAGVDLLKKYKSGDVIFHWHSKQNTKPSRCIPKYLLCIKGNK